MSSDNQPFTSQFRPSCLEDLVGQDRAKDAVGPWLRQNRVPGAILISGPRSAGKTTLSRIIGKSVLCEAAVEGKPCGKCKACVALQKGTHPDLIEIDAGAERGIAEVRALRERLQMRPVFGRKKVIIMDESHSLTKDAGGALLKITEEPPDHIILIFATTNPEKMLDTLQSRCTKIPLRPITVEECTALLKRITANKGLDKVGITDAHLRKIAIAVHAHPREALKALDQVYTMTLDNQEYGKALDVATVNSFIANVAVSDVDSSAEHIARAILDGSPGSAMKRAEDLRGSAEPMLARLLSVFRQAAILATAPKLFDPSYSEILGDLQLLKLEDKMARKEAVISIYEVFIQLRVQTATYMVPIHEVIDASIARAALIAQKVLPPKEPKTKAIAVVPDVLLSPAEVEAAKEPEVQKKKAPDAADPLAGFVPKKKNV